MAEQKHWAITERGFELTKPYLFRPWINYMGNNEYGLRLSHLGDGFSTTLVEPRKTITHYDYYVPNKGRLVYVKDGETLWSPSYNPVKTELDQYKCTHGLGFTEFDSVKDGVRVRTRHFLPINGQYEFMTVEVENSASVVKELAVYTAVEFLLYDNHSVDPIYYSWFTNSRCESDNKTLSFFKTDADTVHGFISATEEPTSYDLSTSVFKGDGDAQNPEAVWAPRLTGTPSAGDPYGGMFHYQLKLAPGERKSIGFYIGEGEDKLSEARKTYPSYEAIAAHFAEVEKYWKTRSTRREFDYLSEDTFRNYMNSFMPYQIFQQAEGLVRSVYRGYRDVAQDAMGLSYYDVEHAGKLIMDLMPHMFANGRCLRQWNTSGTLHDDRDFRDLQMWIPLAVEKYLQNGGTIDILDREAPFFQSDEKGTVLEHMVRGFEYVLQFGPHDLIHMGKGDWNDALSGLGAKGESLWLNQMAYYSLGILKDLAQKAGKELRLDVDAIQERLYKGVIAGWTGEHFLRGYTENGDVVGGEDRIFLLPQAWFTISGMAKRDPAKAKIALESMCTKLDNPNGILVCYPSFDKLDPKVGNLSALAPGMAENFAVYNHASAFGVYSLLIAGMEEEAVKFLRRLVPMYKDPTKTKAEPFVLVNFYNGGYYPEKSGQGGIPWLTGTVNWLAMAAFDHLVPKQIQV